MTTATPDVRRPEPQTRRPENSVAAVHVTLAFVLAAAIISAPLWYMATHPVRTPVSQPTKSFPPVVALGDGRAIFVGSVGALDQPAENYHGMYYLLEKDGVVKRLDIDFPISVSGEFPIAIPR